MRYKVQELAGLIVIALIVSAGITQLVVGLAVADIADEQMQRRFRTCI